MLHVIATIELHPGRREEFLAEFGKVVPSVRAEAGCLEYTAATEVATDIPAQAAVRPDVVVVIEKWRDLNDLKAHLAAPHMAAYREAVRAYVANVNLSVLQTVQE